ncbi:PepSY-associated TM helix domain-containing protein [Frankia nepalensis]|uniref:PepSY-associated TM helix domain-containing protein n=1 Tax=Frankia nepalensis TaxID=1836974 RepID=UPI002889CA9B|nr:PepSY domain-containing protein [Frankia nepalensis]
MTASEEPLSTATVVKPVDAEAAARTGRPGEAVATEADEARGSVRARRSIAPLLLRLHFYAGILIAPFLVVAAVTGLLFVFTPQLDRLVYEDEFFADGRGQQRPLAEQVQAAVAAHPEGSAGSMILTGEDDRTTGVVFFVDALGEKQDTVYVDPYTSEIHGSLVTWWGSTPLQTWFDDLHRNLHLGDLGLHYSELAASWLWVVVLGGALLWLRRLRAGREGRGRAVRRALLPDLSARRGVRRTRGWHATTGLWLAAGLLILSVTGLTWSRYAGGHFGDLVDAVGGHAAELSTEVEQAPAGSGHHHDGTGGNATAVDLTAIDRVVATARAAGLDGPIEVGLPAEAGAAWTVTQTDKQWPVRFDAVAVDPTGQKITDRVDYADWPTPAKLTRLGINAHMGTLFGLANQILLAALAIGLLCVIVWGYRMWWQRRPTRADRTRPVGTPPARGAWRHLPPWALAVGVVVAAAVGWALPLLGLSLAAFLVIDLAAGPLTRARARLRGLPDQNRV